MGSKLLFKAWFMLTGGRGSRVKKWQNELHQTAKVGGILARNVSLPKTLHANRKKHHRERKYDSRVIFCLQQVNTGEHSNIQPSISASAFYHFILLSVQTRMKCLDVGF
uniref:Uncharacterized protein n=1 Tax=Sphaerodactylus townsendi TaxID=933632 RepID=A0ACB8FRQ1_9SAUR